MQTQLSQRLAPLLQGFKKAEDFVQELLDDSLEDCLQRIAGEEKIPAARLRKHADQVIQNMMHRLQQPTEKKQCRAKTKAKMQCKRKAAGLSDFCTRHKDQRRAYEHDLIARRQVAVHDAKMRASRAKGHTHRWMGEFHMDCQACIDCQPAPDATSYSGQSIGKATSVEVSSKPLGRS